MNQHQEMLILFGKKKNQTKTHLYVSGLYISYGREMAIEALSERLDNLILSEESSEEPEEYDEIPRPSISRRPRRLTWSRHIDIRSFFAPGIT